VGIERAIVAEGADGDVGEVVILSEDAMDEIGADFAGGAGDEDAFHEGFLFLRFEMFGTVRSRGRTMIPMMRAVLRGCKQIDWRLTMGDGGVGRLMEVRVNL